MSRPFRLQENYRVLSFFSDLEQAGGIMPRCGHEEQHGNGEPGIGA